MPIADGVSFDLAFVWGFQIAFAVLAYVILGGFDLRLGMLLAAERWRGVRDIAFIGGSALASLPQGIALGGLLQGIAIDRAARRHAGGSWGRLTPFSRAAGVAVMVIAGPMFRALTVRGQGRWPLVRALAMVVLRLMGPGICVVPHTVPTEITLRDAAAPYESQHFMIVGAGAPFPAILAHTAHADRAFRGEVDPEAGHRRRGR